jgi:hypothetical protein
MPDRAGADSTIARVVARTSRRSAGRHIRFDSGLGVLRPTRPTPANKPAASNIRVRRGGAVIALAHRSPER